YGPAPAEIAAWVAACFDRLIAMRADIVCTSLPIERLERLSALQYRVARSLLFPGRRLPFEAALSRAGEVVERVEGLAAQRRIPFIELPAAWYGADPIHIRR